MWGKGKMKDNERRFVNVISWLIIGVTSAIVFHLFDLNLIARFCAAVGVIPFVLWVMAGILGELSKRV